MIRKGSGHPDVILNCVICGKEFTVKYGARNSRKTCSGRGVGCSRILAEQKVSAEERGKAISAGKIGKTHIGVPHSEETKKILSQKTGERMRDPSRNPFVGKKRTAESREKQSRTRAQKFVDGSYKWKIWTDGGFVDTKKSGTIWCRSSWEKRIAVQLDQDETVVTFLVEPFKIPYYRKEGSKLNLRHYVPDFLVTYVDGTKKLIEVKPKCHIDAEINVAKFAAAREYCSKIGIIFEVWTQENLT